jgi:tetratricopeptide (TPR) repeat protein
MGARVFALVAAFPAVVALAQGSWLEPVRALDQQGQTRDALQRLEADPARLADDTEARLLHGVLLAKLGRTAEARQIYRQLIRERPDLPEAYNNLAVMHAAAGEYDTAIEILKQGLATHPSYRTTFDNLTKVYGKLASEAYSKALGDQRVDAEPLRLALLDGLTPPPSGPAAAEAVPAQPPVPTEPSQHVTAALSPTEPAATPPPTGPPPADLADWETEEAIWGTVQAWAEAWSTQQPDLYLGYYGADFAPPGGAPRSEWEQLRRRRLTAPEFIEISLARLEVERPSPERAIARFVQSYESDSYGDTVTKTLELVSTEAGWRIVAEIVEESSP